MWLRWKEQKSGSGATRSEECKLKQNEEDLQIKRKPGESVPEVVWKNGIPFLSFPLLENTGLVIQAFTTRLGGVSTGPQASMNLSFTRKDDPRKVRENHRLVAEALRYDQNRAVLSHQTHTDNIYVVTEEDAGKGIAREKGYTGIDGLMTNVPGMALITFFADCVPLYFLDPVHRAIALVHSGWRGTVKRIGPQAVRRMGAVYGSRPEDILACIGPSICGDCYEVGEEVAVHFRSGFSAEQAEQILKQKENGKYQLDLWKANEYLLRDAGICAEHLQITGICTRCNPDLLFSHRAMGEERGNLSAILCLRE